MEPIHFHPDNDPGGTFGEALHSVAGSLNSALRPYVQASDEAVLAGAERGELVDPNPVIS